MDTSQVLKKVGQVLSDLKDGDGDVARQIIRAASPEEARLIEKALTELSSRLDATPLGGLHNMVFHLALRGHSRRSIARTVPGGAWSTIVALRNAIPERYYELLHEIPR